MKYPIIFFLCFFLINSDSVAQDCNVKSKSDWRLVEVEYIESRSETSTLKIAGEYRQKISERKKNKIKSPKDLPKRKLRRIKKHVASLGRCKVYIDIYGIYNLPSGIYYYWLK